MDHLVDQELQAKLLEVMPNNCDIMALHRVLLELKQYSVPGAVLGPGLQSRRQLARTKVLVPRSLRTLT